MIIPETLIATAPGLLGRLVSYIEEDSIYSQPQLALGAALSFLSVMKAHSVRSESNLRTNIVAIGLARSGEGKDWALEKIQTLIEGTGFDFLLGGIPASDVALLRMLSEFPRRIILWDEIGIDLKRMTAKNAAEYRSAILKIIMSSFSSAGRKMRGVEYRNSDGNSPCIVVDDPSLTIYGVSTPIRFHQSLRSDYIIDGFIPRILIFQGIENPPIRYKNFKRQSNAQSLQGLREEVMERFAARDVAAHGGPAPRAIETVGFAKDALTVLADNIEIYELMKEGSGSEAARAIYSRATEHFIKLCLIVEDNFLVSKQTAEWVFELVKHLLVTSAESVGNIFDTPHEQQKKYLTGIVRESKVISRSDLCRKTQNMIPRERNEAIKDLLDAEIIHVEYKADNDSRKKTAFYSCR